MANKALVCLFLISLVALSSAQQNCPLTSLLTLTFCSAGTCNIDSVALALLCGLNLNQLTNPIVNIALPSSTTININTGAAIALGGININSTASATATVNLGNAVVVANDIVATGASIINVASGAVVTVRGRLQVAAQSTVNIAGNLTVQGATFIYGRIALAGNVVTGAAQTAWLVATSTTITVQGSASASAYITGNGGIDGNVDLSSNVTIAAGNSPGAVYIRGDFSMSDTTTLEIDYDSATSYDRLYISGKFSRNGILHVDFETSSRPSDGQVFVIATHSSASGDFNIARGNFGDSSLSKVHPKYGSLTTSFQYGSAATVALPIALMALCLLGLVF